MTKTVDIVVAVATAAMHWRSDDEMPVCLEADWRLDHKTVARLRRQRTCAAHGLIRKEDGLGRCLARQ